MYATRHGWGGPLGRGCVADQQAVCVEWGCKDRQCCTGLPTSLGRPWTKSEGGSEGRQDPFPAAPCCWNLLSKCIAIQLNPNKQSNSSRDLVKWLTQSGGWGQ